MYYHDREDERRAHREIWTINIIGGAVVIGVLIAEALGWWTMAGGG